MAYQAPRWDILDAPFHVDRSLEEYQYIEVQERRGDDLREQDKYQLHLENNDAWHVLGEAKLHVDFQITDQPLTDDQLKDSTFVTHLKEKNGVILQDGFDLFSRAEVSFNGQEVEVINEPGTVHFMKHICSYGDDYNSVADKQYWYPVSAPDFVIDNDGTVVHDILLSTNDSLQDPEGVERPLKYLGKRPHDQANPIIGEVENSFIIFNSAGSTDGNLETVNADDNTEPDRNVEVGDIAYFDGFEWIRVPLERQRMDYCEGVPFSGWRTWQPHNDHTSNIQLRTLEEDGDDGSTNYAISEQDGVRANPRFSKQFGRGVKQLIKDQTCILPLKEIFGSLQTAGSKLTRGTTMTIDLYKNKSPAAILYVKGSGAANITVKIKSLRLFVPRVKPNPVAQKMLNAALVQTPQVVDKYAHHHLFRFVDLPQTQTSNDLNIPVDSNRPLYTLVMFQESEQRTDIRRNPYQASIETDVPLGNCYLKNHDMQFPSSLYTLGNGDLPRMYDDLAELFSKQRAWGNGNDSLQIDLDQFASVHSIIGFDMTMTDPAISEKYRSSDLQLHYTLTEQPNGPYDVVVLVINEKTITTKHIGSQTKIFK